METITRQQMIDALNGMKGARIISIVTMVDARLRKTDNPFQGVRKISGVNGVINWNYEKAVNRQREREGTEGNFEAHPRKWGQRIEGTPFVAHKDELYLELKVESTDTPTYVDSAGNVIEKEKIKAFLPTQSSNAEHQGVEKEIILRDYKVSGITQITYGGNTYLVK